MLDDDKLIELLVRRDELLEQGHEAPPEAVCQDCPQLADEYKARLEVLRRTDWLFDTRSVNDEESVTSAWTAAAAAETDLPVSSLTVEAFLHAIANSGLMTAEEIEEVRSSDSGEPPVDSRSLAGQLVRQKKLTPYQASVLLAERDDPLLLDRYIILDTIGSGGMGVVFKALHRSLDRVVALKMLPPRAVDSEEKVKRFRREVKTAAMLTHPNIVITHDAHEANSVHFLVMEYVNGSDLNQLVKTRGPLPATTAVDYVLQAARGLEHAHAQGIVHRDIKPGNLLLDANGTVKVLDLGLARLKSSNGTTLQTDELTSAGDVMGTAAYMSPEQAANTHDADARSDVYSLGCTLYFLLTGRPPYKADTFVNTILAHREQPIPSLTEQRDDVPEDVIALYRRMMAKKPDDRYPSMTAVIQAIGECQAAWKEPAVAEPPPAERTTAQLPDTVVSRPKASSKGKVWRWAAGAVGLALVTWLFLSVVFKVRTPEGTLVVEVNEPAAEVQIDDGKVTLTTPGEGQSVEIEVDAGTHLLKVRKGGFETFTKEFTIRAKGKEVVKATLVPIARPTASLDGTQPPAPLADKEAPTAADPHRRAAQTILNLGGRVAVLSVQGQQQVNDPSQLPSGRYALLHISLSDKGREVTDANTRFLDDLKYVNQLELDDTSITDETLQHVCRVENLPHATLTRTKITDRGVSLLAELKDLRNLEINDNPQIGDGACSAIARLTRLRFLDLSGTSITDAGLAPLAALVNLRDLCLNDCKRITAAGLQHLQQLPSLQQLPLRRTTISDEAVAVLSQFRNLRLLDLRDTQVSKDGAGRLQALMPDCAVLHPSLPARSGERQAAQWILDNGGVLGSYGVSRPIESVPEESFAIPSIVFNDPKYPTSGAANLVGMSSIRWLSWSYLTGSDAECESIGKLRSLSMLHLLGRDLSEVGLARLKGLTELEHLGLCSEKIDDAALAHLGVFQHLEGLGLQIPISGDGLAHLGALGDSLLKLNLATCPKLRGSALEHLTRLTRLRLLDLSDTPVADDAVPHLRRMTSLRILVLARTKLSPAGAAELQQALPDCVVLHESLENVPRAARPKDSTPPDSPPSATVADPHRRAAEAVLRLGGAVNLAVMGKPCPQVSHIDQLPPGRFAVTNVFLTQIEGLADDDLELLDELKYLNSLELRDVPITDEGLRHVGRIENLRFLWVGGTKVTGRGFSHLSGLGDLHSLDLSGNAGIRDEDACREIAKLTDLRRLILSDTLISDQGLARLSSLGELRELHLNDCPRITGAGLAQLERLASLQVLTLRSAASISDEAVDGLAKLRNLRLLDLRRTPVTKVGASRLQEALPDCTVLHETLPAGPGELPAARWLVEHGYTPNYYNPSAYTRASSTAVPEEAFGVCGVQLDSRISGAADLVGMHCLRDLLWAGQKNADAECESIGQMKGLSQLNLISSDISTIGLKRLKPLTELEGLGLGHCRNIHDDSLVHLSAFPQVRGLGLDGTRISDEGLRHLAPLEDSLRDLKLWGCPNINGAGLRHLTGLTKLRCLWCRGTPLTDEALPHLQQMTSLRILDVSETKLSAEAAAALQEALPDCVVLHESLADVPFGEQPNG